MNCQWNEFNVVLSVYFCRFLCCLKLRFTEPRNKLNALVTTRKVFFMKVGAPSRNNVILEVYLNKLYKSQEKNHGKSRSWRSVVIWWSWRSVAMIEEESGDDSDLISTIAIHFLTSPNLRKIFERKIRVLHVSWVVCWFSPLPRGFFSGSFIFPPSKTN
jgi:hypothetical protein